MKRSNRVLEFAVLALIAIGTCGSTPGYIGGCNTRPGSVDPVAYCRQRETYICARTRVVEMATGVAEYEANHTGCVGRIERQCAGANFAVGCAPSEQSTNACLAALIDPGRIFMPVASLEECSAICAGSGGGTGPEGI